MGARAKISKIFFIGGGGGGGILLIHLMPRLPWVMFITS